MSATTRQLIRDAFIEALTVDRDPDIPAATKRRWVPSESNRCPSIGVFFLEEQAQPVGGRHGGLVERPLKIATQCVQAVATPDLADDAIEPLLAHIVARLGSANLDGLVLDISELSTKWETAALDRFYIAATVIWSVQYQTRRNDLSARQ
jgi:hypothetical protein